MPVPDSVTLLDPASYFVERLGHAEIDLDPFPHFFLENVFPDDYYQTLLSQLPEESIYENLFEVTDLKLDHFRHRDQRDFAGNWTHALPEKQKDFWVDFQDALFGTQITSAVIEAFAAQFLTDCGKVPNTSEVSTEAQLIRHRAGYFLGPHSDLYTKRVVLLFYLARDQSLPQLGTSLYRPRDASFECPQGTHYSFDEFVNVKTLPYRPNSLLGFFRSGRSFHGVEPLSEHLLGNCSRDLIQYVIYDRAARDLQLQRRRENEQRILGNAH